MSITSRVENLYEHIKREKLSTEKALRLRYLKYDPSLIFDWSHRSTDRWQVELMRKLSGSVNSGEGGLRTIVAASRQVGKSEFASLWITWSLITHGHSIAITSPSFRQSLELAGKVRSHVYNLGLSETDRDSITDFKLATGGRLIVLPGDGSARTSRGFTIDQLIVDEAAFLESDEIIAALGPSLALANGSILMVSSPGGTKGLFFDCWRSDRFHKVKVRADECARISAEFLEEQRSILTSSQYSREYEGEFASDNGQWIKPEWIDQALYDPSEEDDSWR